MPDSIRRPNAVSRRAFVKGALGAAVALPHSLALAAEPRATGPRPNFVYFMTDDQAAHAMSCAGSKVYQTPNMDRLAAEGVRFLNTFVTNSLCAPSRASIMTGLYSHTHGVRTNNAPALSREHSVFTDYLREAGYHTCFIGKWHMQGEHPPFDYWLGFSGQGVYFNQQLLDFEGKLVKEQGYVTDLLGDRAVAYLREHRQDPFCLLLWFKAPHRAWEPAPRHLTALEGVTIPDPPTFHDDYAGRPAAIRKTEMQVEIAKPGKDFQGWVKDYYRTLLAVDENVGRVLKALDELGLTDNTCVIYCSDNGFFLGEHHFFDKRLMYEPSIRIPMLLRYPRLIRKGGCRLEQMTLNVDLAPTILELAGLEAPAHMHGCSWLPLLKGQQAKSPTRQSRYGDGAWRDSWLYEYYEYPAVHMVAKNRGVRTRRWKYIHYFEQPEEFELYDLQTDPNEVNNLYGKPRYEKTVEHLREEMLRLRRETKDPDLEQA